jgi:hypothetical protein
MKREFAVYRRVDLEVVNGKWADRSTDVEVRVMARAEGYAMVRNKGCMPFVVSEKHLQPPSK